MPADATDRDFSQPISPLAPRGDWKPWAGALVSVALLGCVLFQLAHTPSGVLGQVMRLGPAFWLVFAALYFAQSIAELAIFGRLWRLPASAFPVLLRKNVLNEIVLGYSGEVYLYLWARKRVGLEGAPFGAIKDVNILSALAGNALTLVMLAAAASTLHLAELGRLLGPALWSGVAVAGLSLVIVALGRRVFTLDRRELAFVARVHVLRLAATTGLTLLMWKLAMPGPPFSLWVALLALRLVISRLPLLTNKDLVFANLVFVFLGAQTPVAALLGALSVATLAAHLVVLGGLAALDARRAAAVS